MSSLVCNSFDEQYKRIQTFRNHYLNMIRILLKNKLNLTFDQMLTYNEIELNINQLMNSITEFTKNIKKNNNNNLNNHNLKTEDIKIIHTFISFLPFMILYYNTLNTCNLDNTKNTQNILNSSYDYDYNITNNDTLKIPLD